VLQYLAAAGIGRLIIVDHDRVEESNLHRQPLYRMSDIGQPKVEAARAALAALNPGTGVEAVCERLSSMNVGPLVQSASVVIDAADSFAVTYLLSDTCQGLEKPLVSASVLGLAGYVGVFCGGSPSYRAVFPELPRSAGSCAEAGVLGTAVGVLGTLEAHLALALLLDWQPPVRGRMLSLDLRTLHVGAFSFAGANEPTQAPIPFIATAEVEASDVVIDLRSLSEAPVSPFSSALRIEVEALERTRLEFPDHARIVLCCRSGLRAWRAARVLRNLGHQRLALIALGE
jgi:molybdopterin/thiamine biosynthesis adenylyltransferase/rhodanese-related sulfurtransferase